ncbi:MAG: amidohydrolase family protein [Candidatus Woesearchaeota archaeon]
MKQRNILDFHAHIGKDKDGTGLSIEQLLQSMEACGITHSVVFPFNERKTTVEEASMQLYSQSQGHPLYPFFRFDPKDMTPERLKERLNSFYGVKLHPRSQNFDPLDERFFGLYEVIDASGKPLLFHSRYEDDPDTGMINPNSNPARIAGLAEEFPSLNLVIGHFGSYSAFVRKKMGDCPNIYLETSIGWSTPTFIELVANQVGAHRLLFGSDFPYSYSKSQILELEKITLSNLKSADKEKILYHNAAHLLMME